MTYAVLGGDQRQLELANLLRRDGKRVLTWGFDRKTDTDKPEEGTEADVVVLPLPVSDNGADLYLPLSQKRLPLTDLWPLLRNGQTVIGGGVSAAVQSKAEAAGVSLLDYFSREETQIANAVPTAEGAIAAAMAQSRRTIHGAEALVIGYGRIGKVLSEKLAALGAEVTVTARRYSDTAWAKARGLRVLSTGELTGRLGRFSLVFNTVPAQIMGRQLLRELTDSCIVVDLASPPGGVDRTAGEALGLHIICARGLPGKVAPLTAAEAIRDGIYHILEERGESY